MASVTRFFFAVNVLLARVPTSVVAKAEKEALLAFQHMVSGMGGGRDSGSVNGDVDVDALLDPDYLRRHAHEPLRKFVQEPSSNEQAVPGFSCK